MAMPMYKIRIIANACITRYDRGERTMTDIVNSYPMADEDKSFVIAEVIVRRQDIKL